MKLSITKYTVLFMMVCGILFLYYSCKKTEDPIKFKHGLFPETVVNLNNLNDKLGVNNNEYIIKGDIAMVYSKSEGWSNLEQGAISYIFDQTTGDFRLSFGATNDAFTQNIINKAAAQGKNTTPYRFFCTIDGFEYFMFSSKNGEDNSDFFYLKNSPVFGANYPEIQGPYPVTLLNTPANNAYISFNNNFDTAYFSSDRAGNFDIYMQTFSLIKPLSDQLNQSFVASAKPDNINSSANDMCPFIHKNVMVFSSDRLGGIGGFDLYYSVFKNGKWSSPINFGPEINTEADEINPILGSVKDFKNSYMIFSRYSEEKNEYEQYFTGIYLPK